MTKSVLITGSSGLIGSEICRKFLAEGYYVYGFDLKKGDLQDVNFEFVKCDLSKHDSVRSAFRKIKNLHVLVNNAAATDKTFVSADRLKIKDWEKGIAINITSVFLLSQLSRKMLRTSKGCIVNISSTRRLMSEPDTPLYSASKGAIFSLTHSLAISWGPDIRVNCVSPGWIAGPDEKLKAKDHSQHPVGRVGKPQDISSAVFYLASDAAGFITGQDFVVDGGMTRKMIYAD